MRLGRRSIIMGTVLISLGLLAACGLHRHCPFRGKEFSKHVLRRLDSRVKKLDLSGSQEEKYQEIRLELETHLRAFREDRDQFFTDLKREMDRETPDMHLLRGLAQEHIEAMPERMEEVLDLFVDFYDILHESQKAQLWQHVKKRMRRP